MTTIRIAQPLLATCPTGKRPFLTAAAALCEMRVLLLRSKAAPGLMNAYQCTACGQWHNGHVRKGVL